MKVVKPRKNYKRGIQTYIVLTVIVLIAAGVYGFFQFQELSEVRRAIASGQTTLADLQSSERTISNTYTEIKSVYDDNFSTIKESINAVYPTEEEYTDLTRLLDDFITKNNQTTLNPIFMSDLKFSNPRIDQENDYAVLPFTLTLSTTRDNFEKFLAFVENSGSLDTGVRMMDIKSISINFPSQQTTSFVTAVEESQVPTMNVSVSLNAYFQPPPITEA